jgi:hypothetical protein
MSKTVKPEKKPIKVLKEVNYWKLKWLKNASENGGAMQRCIDKTDEHDDIVVNSVTRKTGRMWTKCTANDLVRLCKKNHGIYEVIYRYPHKVYFDIDKSSKDAALLKKVKKQILKHFPKAQMAISGSVTDAKTSYHIVLNNYIIESDEDREKMKYLCKELGEEYDSKVYTQNRNMKCPNQSKPDGRVQEIIEDNDMEHHMITCFIPNKVRKITYELSKEVKNEHDIHQPFDISSIKAQKLPIPDDFDQNNINAYTLLMMSPNGPEYDHKYTHLHARFAYNNDLSFEQFWQWCKIKNDTDDRLKKWFRHWEKLDDFPTVTCERFMKILERTYPDIFKDRAFRNFKAMMDIEGTVSTDVLTLDNFETEAKYIIADMPMGGRKTTTTIEYLRENEGKTWCWITPRQTLAQDTTTRLRKEGFEVLNYLECKSTKSKKHLSTAKHIIINDCSLHYLEDNKFDIVVVDEIETVLLNWISTATHDGGEKKWLKTNWKKFCDIFKTANKVILLDAFTTTRTTQLCKDIDPEESQHIIKPAERKHVRDLNYIKGNHVDFYHRVIRDLKKGKKLFIFYPFVKQNEKQKRLGIEDLAKKIRSETKKKCIAYHSTISDKVNDTLKDVNKTWSQYDCVITTSKITVGVSYEMEHFDQIYIGIASHNMPRDLIQSSCRVRNAKDKIINVMTLASWSFPITDETDDIDDIYVNLKNGIYKEKKAPIQQTFKLFCKIAGFKFNQVNETVSKSVREEYKKYFESADFAFKYKNIPTISPEQYDELQQKVYTNTSEMIDKMMIHKFNYQMAFNDDTPESVMEDVWDNKKESFFFQFMNVKYGHHKKIIDIQESLGIFNIANITTNGLKGIKIDSDMRKKILKYVVTRYEHKKSTDMKLLALLFNSHYNINVLNYNKNKGSKNDGRWDISDDFKKYVQIADKYTIEPINDNDINDIATEIDPLDIIL